MTARTSSAYTDCVLLWPDGKRKAGCVVAFRIDSVQGARQKLRENRCAWVLPGDVEKVLEGAASGETA